MSFLSTPGFFNVLDSWAGSPPGPMVAGTVSYVQAQNNALVLQNAIWAAQVASATTCGGTDVAAEIVIPGHNVVPGPVGPGGIDKGAAYFLAIPPVNVSANAAVIIKCNWPLKIKGTGNVKLVMMLDSNHKTGDMFAISNGAAGDNTGGITFEDLTLQYPTPPGPITPTPVAVHLLSGGGAQNIRLNRCVLQDCPIGLWAEDGLQISMFECLITYSANGNVGTGVWLGNTTSGDAAK
jgi:hypothetical protein